MIYSATIRTFLFLLVVASSGNIAFAGVGLLGWEACESNWSGMQIPPEDPIPTIQHEDDLTVVSSCTQHQSTASTICSDRNALELTKVSSPHFASEDCHFVKPIPLELLKVPITKFID